MRSKKVTTISELFETVNRLRKLTGTSGGGAPLVSPAFTGIPTVPTAAVDTNTTQIATTAFVIGQGYSKLASPTFTGTPSAPTAIAGTNTTQLATTAFVTSAVSGIGASEDYEQEVKKYRSLNSPVKAFNFAPDRITVTGTALVSQQIRFFAIRVPLGGTYTGVSYYLSASGVFTANNENRVGLYSISGSTLTLVASSTNDATGALWKGAATAYTTQAFSTPATLTAGTYFVAALYSSSAQTTAPGFYSDNVVGNLAFLKPGGDTFSFAVLSTQTALPASATMASLGASTSRPWIALY